MGMMFARHNRVWLSQAAWARVTHVHGMDGMHAQNFVQWADNNWPLVMRRLEADLPANMVALGMPLPPDTDNHKKVRLALLVHRDEITRTEDPIHLLDVTAAVPSHWRSAYQSFCKEIASLRLEMRVFGSFAMQAFTGLPYLSDSSDIDLLFTPHSNHQLAAGLSVLADYEKWLPLDGEIVFPSGRAVSWKEWMQVGANKQNVYVLTKSLKTVALIRVDTLLAELNDQRQDELIVQAHVKHAPALQQNMQNESTVETQEA